MCSLLPNMAILDEQEYRNAVVCQWIHRRVKSDDQGSLHQQKSNELL